MYGISAPFTGWPISQDSWLQMAETNSGSLKQYESLQGEGWVEPALKWKTQTWKMDRKKERSEKTS